MRNLKECPTVFDSSFITHRSLLIFPPVNNIGIVNITC